MRVVVVAVLLAACGFQAPDYGRPDPTIDAPPAMEPPPTPNVDAAPAPGPITPPGLLVQMVTRECQAAFACRSQYPTTAPPFAEAWGIDLDDCITSDRNYRIKDSVAASCASGVISWNETDARRCFDDPGVPSSCSVLFTGTWWWADACLTALAGSVPDGGSCQNDWECTARDSDCRSGRCTP